MSKQKETAAIFAPKIIGITKNYSGKQLTSDLVAGLIVAIIALPLSIALAIASGVSPEKGLYTAIVAGFVIALFGGSCVNISGPTAAFATIVAGIVAQYGIEGLVLATLMAGILLIVMGLLRFGSLIKYIPNTITTGFTSGIAVTIVIGQLKDFLGLSFAPGTHAVETMEKLSAVSASLPTCNLWALLVGGVSLLVLIVWPKINKKIPASLIAVLVGTLLVSLLKLPVNTIGDLYSISPTLPSLAVPQINGTLIKELFPSAVTIAVLAAIESLLSCVVSDEMIGDRHHSNTELMAQGLGNIFSALFGGIPATGAIARTAANVKNGGRTPVSGMVHAVVLLLVLVLLMPYAAWIPMPVIAAILFMVAYNMCEWRQFVALCKTAPKSDIAVLVLTFLLTVVFDLVVAIEIGMLISIILFMKRMADTTTVRRWIMSDSDAQNKQLKPVSTHTAVFELCGPMFFATSSKLDALFVKDDVNVLILRMQNVPAMDSSAVKVLFTVLENCRKQNVTLLLSHVNKQPLSVLHKSQFIAALGQENVLPNIDEALQYAQTLLE